MKSFLFWAGCRKVANFWDDFCRVQVSEVWGISDILFLRSHVAKPAQLSINFHNYAK